ncbi:hypothetical protein BC351_00690 [Paenibacillus ferrarius]|uniref:HTH cro/C1-type domain-containing protein n=1 Tax=Paenibacillus ferrarius TaxID=1469647 RepID=A0A1V4HS96_9BACL|nr:helix-turn-helix transcriptional regulator [Paenibacillus ferrarius]OPH61790.1 hypothetical protein BC351_00690 [Paenibacillus ferrarius]
MQKRRIIKSNLKELLIKNGIDQKALHKLTNVREATIGEMAKDENKTFSRESINAIIKALDIKSIEELISIVEESEDKNS